MKEHTITWQDGIQRRRHSVNQHTIKHTFKQDQKTANLLNIVSLTTKQLTKMIWSVPTKYEKILHNTVANKFTQRDYSKLLSKEQLTRDHKPNTINSKDLLSSKESFKANRVPLAIAYHWTLPNMSKIMTKNRHILQIHPQSQKVFK